MDASVAANEEKYEFTAVVAHKGDSSKLDLIKELERQTLLEVHQVPCAPGVDEVAFHR